MFKFTIFLSVFLLCFLTSCSTQQVAYQKAQSVRNCVASCDRHLPVCEKACVDQCRYCEKSASEQTHKSYDRYLKNRCVEGKSYILRLQSFHDPLQCRKKTCDCRADHRVCVESCHGVIHKEIRVEKSCC